MEKNDVGAAGTEKKPSPPGEGFGRCVIASPYRPSSVSAYAEPPSPRGRLLPVRRMELKRAGHAAAPTMPRRQSVPLRPCKNQARRENPPCGLSLMYGALSYFRKPRLRMMAGSLALPEQIWKKQMTFSTSTMARHTPPTMGTMMVQHSRAMTMPSRMVTTSNFRA